MSFSSRDGEWTRGSNDTQTNKAGNKNKASTPEHLEDQLFVKVSNPVNETILSTPRSTSNTDVEFPLDQLGPSVDSSEHTTEKHLLPRHTSSPHTSNTAERSNSRLSIICCQICKNCCQETKTLWSPKQFEPQKKHQLEKKEIREECNNRKKEGCCHLHAIVYTTGDQD